MPAISEAAAAASRRNGAASGGPVTAAGKARSALNGLVVGHRAKSFRLRSDEDPAEFAALRESWLADLEPEGPAEVGKVETIVQNQVMLARIEREIGDLEAWHTALPAAERPEAGLLRDARLEALSRLQERLERSVDRAERAFLRLRRARRQGLLGPPPPPPPPPPTRPPPGAKPTEAPAAAPPGPLPPSAWEQERARRLLPLLDRIPTADGRGQWLRGLSRQDQRLLERHLDGRRERGETLPGPLEMALNVLSMIG